ncbi:GDSL family lipase [Chroococcidiopsis cubana CCALA 043]|uniref:SGNH/GDSL hydrolase family protein n=1 Tax=Chroococcidiopsis cubana TaxID=171392 RepID=UPI000D07EDBD|nr:SGNH/GDSL hydrolase family protein [Chroococcidiopsis cubana]PSB60300.1 GDSL family lipase [Chroococcidiopsis cubana CCALA 043]
MQHNPSLVFPTRQFELLKKIYIFGDSFSDVGTLFRATRGKYPPSSTYFQGRYSNGRVWVEYLAEQLHLSSSQSSNFACSGATTGSKGNTLVSGLLTQVQSFTQAHQQTLANALCVIWVGANDYLQQRVSNATVPVENITKAIAALANSGAKNILVANLPDLGQLPATRSSINSASLSGLTLAHNQSLRRSLKLLSQQYPDLQLITLDANALYREVIANPAAFGFTNVTSAYLSGSGACGNPDQFFFWDDLHLTTAAHQIIGERAFAVLAGHLTLGEVTFASESYQFNTSPACFNAV